MKRTLPDKLLSHLSELIAARTALHFPPERWDDLERKAGPAAREFGFENVEAFVSWLASSPMTREQVEILASHLTISETYFWREPRVFEALKDKILPELIRAREGAGRRLRIWSAGCSTGEEPYSIAISLREALPDLKGWNITFLATDINPLILRKAAAGVYGDWSFRNCPTWLLDKYFRRTPDGKRELLPEIRKSVSFAYLNLAEDLFPSPLNNTNAMDIIFCRNVLMYFAPERARRIVRSLRRSLVENGWLMAGASELSQALFPRFEAVHFPGAIVYRKGRGRPQPSMAPSPRSAPASEPERFEFKPPETVSEIGSLAPARDRIPPAAPPAADHEMAPREEEVPRPGAALVRALAGEGRLSEALAVCDKTLAADKMNAGLHYLRAAILRELGRDGEASAALKRALYLEPDFALAHFALGNLALRQGDARTGRRSFENALAVLSSCEDEDILPESDGLAAGRFREIIHATLQIGVTT